MTGSKRPQPLTQSDRRLRKRPNPTTSTTVARSLSDLSVVDITEDQDEIMPIPTSQTEVDEGWRGWSADFDKLKMVWKTGEVEGYGGLVASIQSESG